MEQVIEPKIRGFICVTAHPSGCKAQINKQIKAVQARGQLKNGPKRVLVLGGSTGYGLSSAIVAGFGSQAHVCNVFFERPPSRGKPASPGWYQAVAFHEAMEKAGRTCLSFNADAFSKETKTAVIEALKEKMGPIDLVVYSLAAPRRTGEDGTVYKSCLKPIGKTFSGKSVDTDKKEVISVEIEAANPEEIEATIKVMGGDDWQDWIECLLNANLLAQNARTLAYSYIGPEVTQPIYRSGTIGRAKDHLEQKAKAIHARLKALGTEAGAWVSVNKAVVTQASSAIPVVPLYISILLKVMKQNGTHEGCIEQMVRLFYEKLYLQSGPLVDTEGRIRLDDWEMEPKTQEAVQAIWNKISTENIDELADFAGYRADFLGLFGFGVEGVNYTQPVDIEVQPPQLCSLC